MNKVPLITLLLCLFSCEKQEQEFQYTINPELEVYVNLFYAEAESRGIELKKENLIVEFTEALTNDRCGQCEGTKGKRKEQRRILIQKDRDCWGTKVKENKEALVFHELGHCLLGREHKDDFFGNGAPKSIMTTVFIGPYQPCEYVFNENPESCNFTGRRTYYINELFDEYSTEVPVWAKE